MTLMTICQSRETRMRKILKTRTMIFRCLKVWARIEKLKLRRSQNSWPQKRRWKMKPITHTALPVASLVHLILTDHGTYTPKSTPNIAILTGEKIMTVLKTKTWTLNLWTPGKKCLEILRMLLATLHPDLNARIPACIWRISTLETNPLILSRSTRQPS